RCRSLTRPQPADRRSPNARLRAFTHVMVQRATRETCGRPHGGVGKPTPNGVVAGLWPSHNRLTEGRQTRGLGGSTALWSNVTRETCGRPSGGDRGPSTRGGHVVRP